MRNARESGLGPLLGAVGTRALAAIAHELVQLGHPVLWTRTATLVRELLAAKRDLRLPQLLAKLDRFACIFLDDIGYLQHDRDEDGGALHLPATITVAFGS